MSSDQDVLEFPAEEEGDDDKGQEAEEPLVLPLSRAQKKAFQTEQAKLRGALDQCGNLNYLHLMYRKRFLILLLLLYLAYPTLQLIFDF